MRTDPLKQASAGRCRHDRFCRGAGGRPCDRVGDRVIVRPPAAAHRNATATPVAAACCLRAERSPDPGRLRAHPPTRDPRRARSPGLRSRSRTTASPGRSSEPQLLSAWRTSSPTPYESSSAASSRRSACGSSGQCSRPPRAARQLSAWLCDSPGSPALVIAWSRGRRRMRRGGKGGRQWGEMMAVVGENRGRRRPSAVSQAVLMVQWLWSLSRLCVAVTNRHSDKAADRPLRMKRSMCRLYLIWPNTGSIVIFGWA